MSPSCCRAFFVVGGVGALLTFAIAAHAQQPLPDGPGKEVVERVCGACHDLDTVTGARRTRADWRATVNAMIARGAITTDEEFVTIVDYLVRYVGLVNVNKAAAPEIEAVLGITSNDAIEIVRYRSDHGDFDDLDGLKKVPGIDATVLEERKDRVAFR